MSWWSRADRRGWRRAEERLQADPVPGTPRRRRGRRRWCRGKTGVAHQVATRVARGAEARQRFWFDRASCFRPAWHPAWWVCQHEEYCVGCGKVLRRGLGPACPLFTRDVTYPPPLTPPAGDVDSK